MPHIFADKISINGNTHEALFLIAVHSKAVLLDTGHLNIFETVFLKPRTYFRFRMPMIKPGSESIEKIKSDFPTTSAAEFNSAEFVDYYSRHLVERSKQSADSHHG